MRNLWACFSIALLSASASASEGRVETIHSDFVREVRSWPAGRGAAQVVYVKRPTAELRRGPAATDPVVATVKQGDSLTVLAAEPARLRVRTVTGAEGFISRINVADKKPAGVSEGQLIVSSGTAARQGANAASIRGLSPVAEKYANDMKLSTEALEQVKQMEAVGDGVTPAEVQQFAAEGGVVAP